MNINMAGSPGKNRRFFVGTVSVMGVKRFLIFIGTVSIRFLVSNFRFIGTKMNMIYTFFYLSVSGTCDCNY